jgi:L-serine dehydratase
MMISVFDLFKVGIGPSSSHTTGPMKAAAAFVAALDDRDRGRIRSLRAVLFGSLAWTGKGHATDKAITLGLSGQSPETLDPDKAIEIVRKIAETRQLVLPTGESLSFDPAHDIVFDFDTVLSPSSHPNTMRFAALDSGGEVLREETWVSVGGGFIHKEGDDPSTDASLVSLPFPFRSAAELTEISGRAGLSIADIVLANECARRSKEDVLARLDYILTVMFDCIDRGLRTEGELPGGLKVKRRAHSLKVRFEAARNKNAQLSVEAMDFASLFAIAVNEENAAGGRVVTAPTNGAAGVIPAVLRYYRDYCSGSSHEALRTFLLTAAAIGFLFKMNGSISGAEVGCQGEVGVACSMAAAGLTAALGGSSGQIENAAEIGMEHHLGMTCDPVGGLVQIPCIERNAFGAIKAINATSLALSGDGSHHVTLDQVIKTMMETGADMQAKYKETSRGGLAVNVPNC